MTTAPVNHARIPPGNLLKLFVLAVVGSASLYAGAGTTTYLKATGPQPVVITPNGRKTQLYEESQALLISESEYLGSGKGGWKKLPNTTAEVDELAKVLQQHGFTITRVKDATSQELFAAIQSFTGTCGFLQL